VTGETFMPENPQVQDILKRLIEAESQARQILERAEREAAEIVSRASEGARQSLEATRRELSEALASRLAETEAQGAAQMKERLDRAEAEARDIEERSKHHFAKAVAMVVNFVTHQGG
jgi:V/A-type H+/Na+-transporting ATPase subunit G/H